MPEPLVQCVHFHAAPSARQSRRQRQVRALPRSPALLAVLLMVRPQARRELPPIHAPDPAFWATHGMDVEAAVGGTAGPT